MSDAIILPKRSSVTFEGDEFELAVARTAVSLILENINCPGTAAVGDRVRIDLATENAVIIATDNLSNNPVIGVIKNKVSSTVCNVYLRGIIDLEIPQGKLYLAENGGFTNTPPNPPSDNQSRYLQVLGYSFGNGKINLEPSQNVTKITA